MSNLSKKGKREVLRLLTSKNWNEEQKLALTSDIFQGVPAEKIEKCLFPDMSYEQIRQIAIAYRFGVSESLISCFSDSRLTPRQMITLREGLCNKTFSLPDAEKIKSEMLAPTINRKSLICHKGLAHLRFPADWLENFNRKTSFFGTGNPKCTLGNVGNVGYIRFSNHGAFSIAIVSNTNDGIIIKVKELTKEQTEQIPWGDFCFPWETQTMSRMFGVSDTTINLDEIDYLKNLGSGSGHSKQVL